MGQTRFWHHTWFYSLLLTAAFSVVLAVTKVYVDQRLEQERQRLLSAERKLWQQRFTQIERGLLQRWQSLEMAVGLPWLQQAGLDTKYQIIARLWPGAVYLHTDSQGAWQSLPSNAWSSFAQLRQTNFSCEQLNSSPWLGGGQDFYRVIVWRQASPEGQCQASLLPVLTSLVEPLALPDESGWLLTTPDGERLSSGRDAALIALEYREQLQRTPAVALDVHSRRGQPYLLVQLELLEEAGLPLMITLAQALTDELDDLFHRQDLHGRWWLIWLLGVMPIVAGGFLWPHLRQNGGSRVAHNNSKNRLELALGSSHSGSWEWDISENQVTFSEHWIKLLGLNKEECAKSGIDEWLRRLHPDDRNRSQKLLVDHLKGLSEIFEDEQRILGHTGLYIWFLIRGRVTRRDKQGRATYAIGVYTRIDERKRAGALALKQQEALERLNEIATLTDPDPFEQLRKSLSLGAEYLSLPFGIVSHIVDDIYTVKVQHSPANTLEDEAVYKLPDCYCSDTLKAGDVLSVHHVNNSVYVTHPCYLQTQLECYIGAPIWVSGEIYGTLNFSGPVARANEFSDTERDFVRLLARWVGATLERWFRTQEIVSMSDTFAKLSDSLPGCLCQFQRTPAGRMFFPYASRGISDLCGVTPDQVAQSAEPILTRIDKEDIDRIKSSIEQSARAMTLWVNSWRYHHPERGIIWLRGQTSPEKLADGSVIWHGFLWEVTDEMQAEEHRKYSNRWRQAILDAANISFIATDCDGVIKTFNKGAEAMLGYCSEELVHKRSPSCLHLPEEIISRAKALSEELGYWVKPGFDVFIEKVKKGGTDEYEWTYVRKDGSRFPVILTVTAVYDEAGEVEGYLGVGRDVSVVKEQKEKLRVFAERTQTILNNAADGIIAIQKNGKIDTFNKSAERLFGWKAEEVIGQSVNILMPPQEADVHDNYLQRHRTERVDRVLGRTRSLVGLRRDGSEFPLELALSEIVQDGEPLYIAMVRDITERERVDRMKSEFIATVSHELRTPLTAISGSLRLLDSGAMGTLEGQMERLVHIAYANSSRLIVLVNDLLDMEKLVAGKVEFDWVRTPIVPLLESILEETESYAIEHQVTVVLDTESLVRQTGNRLPLVNVDMNRFKQVMVNLLSNAAKFSLPQGLVTVRLGWESGLVRIDVIDRGVGIPESFHGQIFQKFSQVDSSNTRSKGGTGLGLAITKELVLRMGGDIGFDSVEGEGSRFYVTFPGDLKSRFAKNALPVLPKVLQVEDDPAIQEWVAAIFMGCIKLTGAPTKVKAESLLEREEYDLIILDIILPDGNGLDLIAKVAETQPRTTDIIVLSQVPLSASQRKNCKAVVEKGPMMSDTLVALLDDWLDEHAERSRE